KHSLIHRYFRGAAGSSPALSAGEQPGSGWQGDACRADNPPVSAESARGEFRNRMTGNGKSTTTAVALRRWMARLGTLIIGATKLPGGSAAPAEVTGASVGTEEQSVTLRDARLGAAGITRAWQIYVPRNGELVTPRRDPKLGRDFARQCVVRV